MLRTYDEFALPHLEIPSNILFGKVSQTSIERTGLSEIKIGIHINQASGLGSDYNFDLYARLVENCIVWLAVYSWDERSGKLRGYITTSKSLSDQRKVDRVGHLPNSISEFIYSGERR